MHTVEYGVHLSFIFSDAQKNSLEILLTFDKSCKYIFNWGKRFWIYLIICLMRLHFIDRHVQNNLCTFLLTGKNCWSGIFDYFMRFQIEIIISFCVIYIQFYRSYTGLYKKNWMLSQLYVVIAEIGFANLLCVLQTVYLDIGLHVYSKVKAMFSGWTLFLYEHIVFPLIKLWNFVTAFKMCLKTLHNL